MSSKLLMGILNVTPDSYYERYSTLEKAVERGVCMVNEGADIIDIGGESTRPYANPVSEEEELQRVIPVISELIKKTETPLSIDTMKPLVAQRAIEAGATMINDVTGFTHPAMGELAASTGIKVCIMHMLGKPQTMQDQPHYPDGVIPSLLKWFEERINALIKLGVREEQMILDPGIGFGKTVEDNFTIIDHLNLLKVFNLPLLIGLSRKSFLFKTVKKTAKEVLSATLAMNTIALKNGVSILRVHDIKEHKEILTILDAGKII